MWDISLILPVHFLFPSPSKRVYTTFCWTESTKKYQMTWSCTCFQDTHKQKKKKNRGGRRCLDNIGFRDISDTSVYSSVSSKGFLVQWNTMILFPIKHSPPTLHINRVMFCSVLYCSPSDCHWLIGCLTSYVWLIWRPKPSKIKINTAIKERVANLKILFLTNPWRYQTSHCPWKSKSIISPFCPTF